MNGSSVISEPINDSPDDPRHEVQSGGCGFRANPWLMAAAVVAAGLASEVRCQEAVRMSLASEKAAANASQARQALENSSLRLGDSSWIVSSSLAAEANDNIGFSADHRQFDVIWRPAVRVQALVPVTEKNLITSDIDIGYSLYSLHSGLSRVFVGPSSQLGFDAYIGSLWLNVHERFSVTEDAYSDPTVVGTANYSQLQNVAGATADWALNRLEVSAGYDHANYQRIEGRGGLANGDSDAFSASAGYRSGTYTRLGLQTGAAWLGYGAGGGAVNWNVGAFGRLQPDRYITLSAAAGYTSYSPDALRDPPQSKFEGVYGQLGLHHRLNKWVEFDLAASRSITFGFYAGTPDLVAIEANAEWHLFQKLAVATGLTFEHGQQIITGREEFDRIGPRLSLARAISSKLSGLLTYQFYDRAGNQPSGGYQVNVITATLVYRL